MKIRFLRTISVDVEKPRLKEIWDKTFNRWDELLVEEVYTETGNVGATIKTIEGEFLIGVPQDSFVTVPEEKRTITL